MDKSLDEIIASQRPTRGGRGGRGGRGRGRGSGGEGGRGRRGGFGVNRARAMASFKVSGFDFLKIVILVSHEKLAKYLGKSLR